MKSDLIFETNYSNINLSNISLRQDFLTGTVKRFISMVAIVTVVLTDLHPSLHPVSDEHCR